MTLRVVPRTALRSWVARQVKVEQAGVCPLCEKPIDLTIKGEGVADHNHETGELRGVLHRSCNAAEGKIANAAGQWGCKSTAYADIVPFLERLLTYYRSAGTGMQYPMHKTAEEKMTARKVREAKVRAARKARLAVRNQGETQ